MKKYRYLILVLSIAVMVGLTLALWNPMVNFIKDKYGPKKDLLLMDNKLYVIKPYVW